MKAHIIENGVVVNTILATVEEAKFAFPEAVVVDGELGAIGWLWDGETLTPPPTPAPSPEEIQQSIVRATQERLDTFARTRNYDGILSAATYATSMVPKFAVEGQYAVEARDMTWATLYQILEEVQAGTRPVPESFADVEPDLPVLEWPVIAQPEPAPEPAPEPEPTPEEPV